MSDGRSFDYYYGAESEQFSFIRIPKLLLLDPRFSGLQKKSVLLYGLFLDRMSLSVKHGWLDKDGRVYIRYMVKEIADDMNTSEPSVNKYLKELEQIGLVEKERIGLGQGNILYVKDFISREIEDKEEINDIEFDYYYGTESSQFTFIRVPKLLLFYPRFKDLSIESVILYGLLLDRMGLSMKNGWIDEDGRVYIRFKIKEIQETMGVFETTAANYLKELETIGLVEKKRTGIAQGNILYVKNFISADLRSKAFITHKIFMQGAVKIDSKLQRYNEKIQEERCLKASKTAIYKDIMGNEAKDFAGNDSTGLYGFSTKNFVGNGVIDFAGHSKTNINNNKYNNNPNHILSEREDKFYAHYFSEIRKENEEVLIGLMDAINKDHVFREGIRKQLSYNFFTNYRNNDIELVDEIIEQMVEIMLDKSSTIRISGKVFEADYVKKKKKRLNRSHIEYILFSLKNTSTEIKNIRNYLRTTIFNALTTMNSHNQVEENHDALMYGLR